MCLRTHICVYMCVHASACTCTVHTDIQACLDLCAHECKDQNSILGVFHESSTYLFWSKSFSLLACSSPSRLDWLSRELQDYPCPCPSPWALKLQVCPIISGTEDQNLCACKPVLHTQDVSSALYLELQHSNTTQQSNSRSLTTCSGNMRFKWSPFCVWMQDRVV